MAKLTIDIEDEHRIEVLAEQLRASMLAEPLAANTTPQAWARLVEDEVDVFRWKARLALMAKALADVAPSLGLEVKDRRQLLYALCEELEPETDPNYVHERIVIWDAIPRDIGSQLEDFLAETPEQVLEPLLS